jgi:hypothetical protein
MSMDADTLKVLVDRELDYLSDTRVLTHIRYRLVEPRAILRKWDYGPPGPKYLCWTVFVDPAFFTGIAFCESGFGPRNPWGLVAPVHSELTSMGMDSGWFPKFLDAYFESRAATALSIWRVFKLDASGAREAVTDENPWDRAWNQMAEFRKREPRLRYVCDHSIRYRPE